MRRTEVSQAAPSIAVVIPALDEARNLPWLFERMPAGVRVVVADNGSSDGTADVARHLGAEVVSESRRGYGAAVWAGTSHLATDPPEVLVIIDADGADDPGQLHRLVDPILSDDYDFVLSQRMPEPGALTLAQRFGNRLATTLMRHRSGHRFTDLGPFRAIRWTAYAALAMQDRTWGWNVEMQLKAVRHKLRILEIPLPYRRRREGSSKISGEIRSAARAGAKILWAVAKYG